MPGRSSQVKHLHNADYRDNAMVHEMCVTACVSWVSDARGVIPTNHGIKSEICASCINIRGGGTCYNLGGAKSFC